MRRAILPAVLVLAVACATPALAGNPKLMLTAADVPASLGVPVGDARAIDNLPAVGGLELCDATLGSRNVTIAGPATFDQSLVVTKSGLVVSQLAYEFSSPQAAANAWKEAERQVSRCSGTSSASQAGIGKVRTSLSHGTLAGVAPVFHFWVNHADTFTSPKATTRQHDVKFSVFTLAGDAILVTSVSAIDKKAIPSAQRQAVFDLAIALSERWTAG